MRAPSEVDWLLSRVQVGDVLFEPVTVQSSWSLLFPILSQAALLRLTQSSVTFRSHSGEESAPAGSYVFFPRGLPCILRGSTGDEGLIASGFCALLALRLGAQALQPELLPESIILPTEEFPSLEALGVEAMRLGPMKEPGSKVLLQRVLEILVVNLLRSWLTRLPQYRLAGLLAMEDPCLSPVMRAIHHEPFADWSLPNLASIASLSRAAFANRFRRCVGLTALKYVRECRLDDAFV